MSAKIKPVVISSLSSYSLLLFPVPDASLFPVLVISFAALSCSHHGLFGACPEGVRSFFRAYPCSIYEAFFRNDHNSYYHYDYKDKVCPHIAYYRFKASCNDAAYGSASKGSSGSQPVQLACRICSSSPLSEKKLDDRNYGKKSGGKSGHLEFHEVAAPLHIRYGCCRSDKQAYKRIGCTDKTLLYRNNGVSCRAHKSQVAQYKEYACRDKDYRSHLGFKELPFLCGCPFRILSYGLSRT